MKPPFTLRGDDTALPKGTRVVTTVAAVDDAGEKHRPGALAVVRDVVVGVGVGVGVGERGGGGEGGGGGERTYVVETPGGAVIRVPRSHLQLERADLLDEIGRRQWDMRRLRDNVIYAAVVGSRAWGLADETSDEDVRGCFVLPFDEHTSLYDVPDEIHDDERQLAAWEIEKLVRQALRADPNTLETLWSPLTKIITPLGQRLVDGRGMFSSMRVVQGFGRYATSQLDKLARAADRARATMFLLDAINRGTITDEKAAQRALPPPEDVHAVVRSLFDRGFLAGASFAALVDAVRSIGPARMAPDEVRPKNAYNLVRLLASCAHWLDDGTPLIHVDGALKDELLAIKRSETPLEKTLERARELARVVEDKAKTSKALPESPDVAAADALVREARRLAARTALATTSASSHVTGPPPTSDVFARRYFPTALPPDVEPAGLRRFLEMKLADKNVVIVGLTGAHAYGFTSPDSDLDLKGIDAAPASAFLGLRNPPNPLEVIEVFEGREMDLSSHELGMAAGLLLKGNGNMLERLLGPLPIVTTPAGDALASIAQRSLSRRVVHHYRGFLHAMRRESDIEARDDDGRRTAKRLLYAYRVACTGAHLLLEGKLVTDVRTLAPVYGFAAHVEELYARKRSAEHSKLSSSDAPPYLDDLPKLEALLDDAVKRTSLPVDPADDVVADLDALLVRARLASS